MNEICLSQYGAGKIDETKGQPHRVLIVLGPPGAGKGTQCKKVAETLRIPHISTGEILRDHVRRATATGRRVKSIMESGDLVPDSLVLSMLAERITQGDCANGFILDGFPRTREQAESLDLYLSARNRTVAPLVIRLVVPQVSLLKRLASRHICPTCEASYSETIQPPRVWGKCDVDGTPLTARLDDRRETALERLRVYEEQISPIIAHYKKCDSALEIDGDRLVDDVTIEILRIIKNRSSRVSAFEIQ